ncbi:ubiquitin carboxyl-terminal hydrolase CYLD-like isoform X2 [Ambystoma mexicanum]|uniref:ubiquitin carboxyl-terminal hydrolase CYLD-like isoform X2 n=1 Tax=Ambystoma mexicanum TaxID=8296 RepID=UPI0037E948C0
MSQRTREVCKLYIATHDYHGSDETDGKVRIPRGSLLAEDARPSSSNRARLAGVWAKVLDTDRLLRVDQGGLQEVSKRTAGLLEAVTDCEERLALLGNPCQLQRLCEIQKGDRVRVQISSSSREKVPGVVRYCGPMGKSKGNSGILYGVELTDSASGKGFTDGSFLGQQLFSCQENCGVFVPISRIEPTDSLDGQQDGSVERLQPYTTLSGDERTTMIALDTRVFFKMGDERQMGTVVFCDTLPTKKDLGIFVGIKLENPVGSWDGYFKGMKLCDIPSREYGIYLPLTKVYRAPNALVQQLERRNCLPRDGVNKNHQNRNARSQQKGREDSYVHAESPHRAVRPLRIAEAEDASPPSIRHPSPVEDTSPQRSSSHGESHSPGERDAPCWPTLELNSMVEVQDPPIYGVIRWIGKIPECAEKMAGLEVEDAMPLACTDGTCRGIRYFHCAPYKALFVKLRICRPDSRFASLHLPTNQINRCNSIAFKEYSSERVEEDTPPQGWQEEEESLIGWKKGIQGHCNSCYLDATLFSMFAFTPVLDTMLLRPADKNDSDTYSETRDLLRTEIVNPLRKYGYVCATKVMALRKILEAAGQVSGFTSEEKDPEEFLNQLFQVLRVEPLFQIRSHGGKDTNGCIFYQIFTEIKQSITVPSVQQLLEWSLVTNDLKFTEAPSCLILQMPRNGKNFKMFSTILPTLELDITDLLEDSPRACRICESLALLECKECFDDPDISPGHIKQYCSICSKQVHRAQRRRTHQPQGLQLPEELNQHTDFHGLVPRQTMQLFAVLCIETSHYVAFTKHGAQDHDWRFFDSMADREGGQNGFNIPRVVPCPEVGEYLNMKPTQLRDLDPKAMPVYARRLLCDAYMCLYHSPSLSLYK